MATFKWSPQSFDDAVAALHDFCSHNQRALHDLLRLIGAVPVPPPASDPSVRLVAIHKPDDPRCAVIVLDDDRETEYPLQAFAADGTKLDVAP